ncbi:deoxyribodipyrimidine photo-lyase [Sporosarcina sp. PTS2304]|uniref:cryptochrome/photolyase family protein n=1 Tax=Sporosarcina sp. PTS2304 TaxID=2283194 RepID=UPI000E0CC9E5|nr:deoxyribodipyrimidine photo-lyase [Sporosarcina sp. PTS2304]AXI00879.1 deoxyribodipyrimidine photo-lyase [Sporosarcina sp. PTS2304]
MSSTIVWFRKDLRLHDHPALVEAVAHGDVLPVFILPETVHEASDWWLHHSLLELQKTFEQHQIQLIVRKGSVVEELTNIQRESGAGQLVYNELYDPESRQLEKELTAAFENIDAQVRSFQGTLLVPPDTIFNKSGQPYKVFTPFWKQLRQEPIAQSLPVPKNMKGPATRFPSLPAEQWGLLADYPWYEKLSWQPGEAAAIECWQTFRRKGLSDYKEGRDIPAQPNVSQLSPYLAWGNISVRSLWYSALATDGVADEQIEAFLRQLAWRDFAHYQLLYFPHMLERPVRPEFEKFPWQPSDENFLAWKKGRTGYPLVDAGMRELWQTGYMHNRVRMIAASFLIKHLLIDWREGMKWFEETLVDWDIANNAMGWQWVAGSGFDASPYFRVFNPIVQGEKFDESATYVKKWIPELRDIPAKYIFEPMKAPASIVESMGDYPKPIVDHRAARARALAAYETCKKN